MSRPLHLALLWHMHQPSYRDPQNGQLALPWVRLHATRAYYDMAWLLERHPNVRATINLVPILVEQLTAYIDGERDRYWALTHKPARLLTPTERAFILRHFFSLPIDQDIRPRARYWRLHQRQRDGRRDPADFNDDDLRDLQVLFNLAWFGFAAREEHPLIDELDAKGRGYTEDDKRKLLDLQIAIIRRLLPTYRRLADRGQIELTATPYHHPILPLIIDTETAARCQPQRPRPPRFAWPDDAREHVNRAVAAHNRRFGHAPRGMWPAEGAVSPEALTLFADAHIRWTATDEAQLHHSLPPQRRRPGDLHRPWRYAIDDHRTIDIVFRDRTLSDLIGFTYAKNPAPVAIEDFIGRLDHIRRHAPTDEPLLVTVALDGENPWEHYPHSGREFLEGLYAALDRRPDLPTVRIGDHLDRHPPRNQLPALHSGSWIGGDYHIWIGSPIENTAWRLLGETRQFFADHAAAADPQAAATARDHLLQAESSDWFWWYGDHFASENDEDFDHLFRAHLRRVYALLDHDPPTTLDRSLYPGRQGHNATPPKTLITPRFDTASSTYFDWAGAGHIDLAGPTGSMYQAAHHFGRLRYGFDLDHLYLRLEPLPDEPLPDLTPLTLQLRLRVHDERIIELPLDGRPATLLPLEGTLDTARAPTQNPRLRSRMHDGIIELALNFADLALTPGDRAALALHLLEGKVTIDRYPQHHDLEFTVPDETFEATHWTV